MQDSILILGIGNLLMGDEGLGVHFVRRMETGSLSDGVVLLDGGTGGFHLMEHFENHPIVILVDATMDGAPAGTISLIEPRFAADFPPALSSHDIGLRDLVEGLAILGRLPKIYLYTVSVAEIQPQCIDLSTAVEAAMGPLQEQVLALIDALRVSQGNRNRVVLPAPTQ